MIKISKPFIGIVFAALSLSSCTTSAGPIDSIDNKNGSSEWITSSKDYTPGGETSSESMHFDDHDSESSYSFSHSESDNDSFDFDSLSSDSHSLDHHEHILDAAVEENRIEPTCTEGGSYDLVNYCEICYEEVMRRHYTIPRLNHDYVAHSSKQRTCTEDGWDAYYTCSRCDYSSFELLPKTGHTLGDILVENEVEPTCTEKGSYDMVFYCGECLEEYSRQTIEVEPTGHSDYVQVKKNIIPATCTESGSYDLVKYCGVCGVKISEEHVNVDALDHDLIHHHEKGSTCLVPGYGDYYKCSRCDYSTIEYKELLDHVGGNKVVENIVPPTATEQGKFDLVVYCTVGGEELSRKTITIGNSDNISLTVNNASIYEQEYYRFHLDGDYDDVTWSVSNEEILTINQSGKMASYGPGESIIFATLPNGEFASAYLEIIEDVIDISVPSGAYFPGSSFDMIVEANSRPNNSYITWSSSNEDVATITENGHVSALKVGETTIRAELPSGKYDECTITIGSHYIYLTASTHSLYKRETFDLNAGSSSPSSVTWSSSNTSVATVSSSGVVTAKADGTAVITASSPLCESKTCTITVKSQTVNLTYSNYSQYYTVSCTFEKKTTSGWLGGSYTNYWATIKITRKSGTWVADSGTYIEIQFYQTGDFWGTDNINSGQIYKCYFSSLITATNSSCTYAPIELYYVSTQYKANWMVSNVYGTISR